GVLIKNISNYDEMLSRQDTVKMLSQIMGTQYFKNIAPQKKDSFSDINKENEYYRYIESAVQNDIIKATGGKFNGTQKITKGEYIVMLLDMLGYKEIAEHDELFSKADSDIYVAICKALEILPVKAGEKFDAKDNLTFAEAAYSLQKALKYFR
ncbi:MAG: S-layer homology domain-containing protein, partial [Ruminiclostridium sp.]